jgi:hypothetical protein
VFSFSPCLLHSCYRSLQKESSRDILTSSSHFAEKAGKRDNRRAVTISSIPEELDDRSGWILGPPSFIHTNPNPARRSLDMHRNKSPLSTNPTKAVSPFSPAEAANHELPHHRTNCAQGQHDCRTRACAVTDFTLVQVSNYALFLLHGCMGVQVFVPVVTL